MATAVLLPALSPTMNEGKITKWLKKEGDKVSSGDAIAECETDKSNLEIEAYDDGILLKIVVPAGSAAPVGSPIAYIGKAGEKIEDAPPAAPKPAEAKAEEKSAPSAPHAAKPPPVAASSAPPAVTAPMPAAPGDRLRASPLAKAIAKDKGVDLSTVAGSGPSGRVVKRDVEEALKKGPPSRPMARANVAKGAPPDSIALSSMRKVIAQRMGEVKPGVPHFYLSIEVEMDAALKVREEAKALDQKLSVNDIIVKATAVALRNFPRLNQSFAGDRILQLHSVDVGIAVAIEDGLITPIVRDADQKGLAEIAGEVRDLAERAKKRSLKPEEYTGGSITVSNLGMFGIDSFIAVINPPQSAILAVGSVTPKAVIRDGQVVARQMMSITLSGDHRVIDGAVGAQYLQVLQSLLEHPLRLLF